jgi:23S rRNA (guanosine2251-2'-O)-methyltransferase
MRKLENSELERLSADDFKSAEKIPVVVVLDNIRSCHNVGSVFRTSDALLVEKIYLCGITATPPDKEIRKTALGAENTVEWDYFTSTVDVVEQLHSNGYTLVAVEQVERSINLNDFFPQANEKIALVFGNEVKGVQQEVVNKCDKTVEIPQYGTKHSFNVSVSAGIVLWDLFNKIRGK